MPSATRVMVAFVAHRVAETAVLLALVTFLSFCLAEWAPGRSDDPNRLEPQYSPAAAAAIRARQGLDRPVLARFSDWIGAVVRGDLGVSTEYDAPVASLVFVRGARTLLLGGAATLLAWVLALPLGVWMAAHAGSALDRGCRAAMTATFAVPEAILALGMMMVAVRTGLAPAGGMLSTRGGTAVTWATAGDLGRHLVLPAVVLAIGLLPVLARHVRASVSGVLNATFITAGRARGVPRRRLLFRSALRAAAAPLVALFGLSIANLLSVSLLVEVITGWPGLGPLLVEATKSRDMPVVAGAVLCSCLLLTLGGLVADVGVQLADPRVRLSSVRARE